MDVDKNGTTQCPEDSGASMGQKDGKSAEGRVYTEQEIRTVRLFLVLKALDQL